MPQELNNNLQEFAKWPSPSPDEIDAAARVLHSGKVRYETGEQGRLFEKEFAESASCKYAIAMANVGVTLDTALRAVGVVRGDHVLISNRTLIRTAQRVVAMGARPVVADVDHESQNLTADTILAMLTPSTKAIVAVHLAGWPCEMDDIMALARERGIKVVEDCTQAQGARYKERPVGSIGDVAVFSFGEDAIMTTGGEGGMFTTNNPEFWEVANDYQAQCDSRLMVQDRDPRVGLRHFPEMLETSGRMTEVQSAIGRIALAKVPEWVETRRQYAASLNSRLGTITGLRVAVPLAHSYHSYYKYYCFIRSERLLPGWNRDRILQAISAEGVPCFVDSCSDAYRQRAFITDRRDPSRLPVATKLRESSLVLLVHPTLKTKNIDYACDVIENVMAAAATTEANTNPPLHSARRANSSL